MRARPSMLAGLCALGLTLASCGGAGSSPASVTPTAPGPTSVPPPSGCESSSQQSLVASSLAFDRACLAVPAHHETLLTLTNNDPGQSHDVAVYRWDSCLATAVRAGDPAACKDPNEGLRYKGAVISSGQITYHILGMRPGKYAFICTVHPSMYGTWNAT